jgi:hypothetical protein
LRERLVVTTKPTQCTLKAARPSCSRRPDDGTLGLSEPHTIIDHPQHSMPSPGPNRRLTVVTHPVHTHPLVHTQIPTLPSSSTTMILFQCFVNHLFQWSVSKSFGIPKQRFSNFFIDRCRLFSTFRDPRGCIPWEQTPPSTEKMIFYIARFRLALFRPR